MSPSDLVIRAPYVVTCDDAMTVIENGAVAARDGRIVAVGPAAAIPIVGAELIEAKGRILMPGLINMHCHAGDSLFRGLVENLPLEPWLQTVWKAERAILRPTTCRLGAELGLAELLLSGVTTVMDMFWFPEETVRAAKALGIRVATGGIFFDPPGMDGHLADRRLADATAFFDAVEDEPLIFAGCLPHGTYTVSPQHLQNAARLSRSRGGFWCTHAAETAAEQATIIERYGRRVITHLAELDLLGPDVVLAHCVHLDTAEIDLLAASGTHVVHNPMSNLKLASGFAPVPALLAAGVNVTLGTDGAISGNDLDMWLAIRLAATLHKAATGNAAAVTTAEALAMATRNGARALNAADRLGSIEPGKAADFILVDIGRPHAAPLFDPVTHLVYSAGRGDVTDVFVGGRRVVEAGRLLTADVGALVAAADALRPAIAASVV
ncbi:amidohydrolase [Pleomorphomonas diazotrophica]|uniref:Amidohydrolase n=1 Tax=Pleomorphomonas diazotrophica TaxID=1166257 RepID=A0A1I4TAC8_9HYPH|nr:amidohydrolase [Pleomorphomonas diazotrophica]PKR89463.1 amidohydrolase [Pleomorphomonas diazotrophica]SFM73571.1 5-methylthioadenosine/S-adenosylhomocysteine deaminase [Pleomorphomonas diazotrophica]